MDPSNFRDYYADLGLKLGASHTSIKAAFHMLAKQHHPDKSGSDDTTAFRRVREAYEKLSDTSYRAAYDKGYWQAKLQTDGNAKTDKEQGYDRPTRTAQYEAEEMRSPSPPPKKPWRKTGEPNWSYFNSKHYQKWQKKDAEHRARHPERNEVKQTSYENQVPTAHGVRVQMTSHPATTQRCTNRTQYWRVQAAGTDYCVFCVGPTKGGNRCQGCEALACQKCLQEIVAVERKASLFSRASGG